MLVLGRAARAARRWFAALRMSRISQALALGESSPRRAARSTTRWHASNCAPKVFRRDRGRFLTRLWTDRGLGGALSKLATEAVLATGCPGSSRSAQTKGCPGAVVATHPSHKRPSHELSTTRRAGDRSRSANGRHTGCPDRPTPLAPHQSKKWATPRPSKAKNNFILRPWPT